MLYYYLEKEQSLGPFTKLEFDSLVKAGKINQETLVYFEGMSSWEPYSDVKGKKIDVMVKEAVDTRKVMEGADEFSTISHFKSIEQLPNAYGNLIDKAEKYIDVARACFMRTRTRRCFLCDDQKPDYMVRITWSSDFPYIHSTLMAVLFGPLIIWLTQSVSLKFDTYHCLSEKAYQRINTEGNSWHWLGWIVVPFLEVICRIGMYIALFSAVSLVFSKYFNPGEIQVHGIIIITYTLLSLTLFWLRSLYRNCIPPVFRQIGKEPFKMENVKIVDRYNV